MPKGFDRKPVEGFKLSKEQLAWTKQFKRLKRAADYLSGVLERGTEMMKEPREMLRQVMINLNDLVERAPSTEIRELHEQPRLEE